MKFQFKPADDRTVALFGHWGEAIVFWLSLAGFLIFSTIAMIRWHDNGRTRQIIEQYALDQQAMQAEIVTLQNQLTNLQELYDSLASLSTGRQLAVMPGNALPADELRSMR